MTYYYTINEEQAYIIAKILGQLSDGKWENCSSMNNYWRFIKIREGAGGRFLLVDLDGLTYKQQQNVNTREKALKWFKARALSLLKDEEADRKSDPDEFRWWRMMAGATAATPDYSHYLADIDYPLTIEEIKTILTEEF